MSDLTFFEKSKLERLFRMGGGYVLDFTNATFEQFFAEVARVRIYDDVYNGFGGSKANRMRGFWAAANNQTVAQAIEALITYGEQEHCLPDDAELISEGLRIAARLAALPAPVAELDSLTAAMEALDFDVVSQAVREALEKDRPETALDRLHTFVTRFVRNLSEQHGVLVDRNKPLQSLFGEYVKRLREDGHLESDMTERILKSSISVLEAFNDVRNNRSLAHDNPILNHDESLLIFNHISGLIRFLQTLEKRIARDQVAQSWTWDDDEPVPF